MSRIPQIGDIWLRVYGPTYLEHLLILQDDVKMGLKNGEGYSVLILETGQYDRAWLEHFQMFCKFHS